MRRSYLLTSTQGIQHFMLEDSDGMVRFEAVGETDSILERNKAMANHNDGYSPSRELRRVGTLPFILSLKWLNEEGWWAFDPDCQDKLCQKLMSSEYAHLRTAPGQLGMSNGVMR